MGSEGKPGLFVVEEGNTTFPEIPVAEETVDRDPRKYPTRVPTG